MNTKLYDYKKQINMFHNIINQVFSDYELIPNSNYAERVATPFSYKHMHEHIC